MIVVVVLGRVARGRQGGEGGVGELGGHLLHHHKLLLWLGEVGWVGAGSNLSRSCSSSSEVLEVLILPGEDLGALVHGLMEFWLTQIVGGLTVLLQIRVNV